MSNGKKEIKVGDLVEVLPGRTIQCIVTSLDAWDHIDIGGAYLADCVTLSHPLNDSFAMHRDYVEVISESR